MGRLTHYYDWIALILLALLGAFGLFIISTIEQGVFFQQFVFFLVGFGLVASISLLDPILLWWAAPYAYVVGIFSLILSYTGPSIRGATRWIMIGSVQLQPSELAKPLFLLAFSYFLAKYPPRKIHYIPLHLVLFLIPFLLVFKQPDLGTGIIYASSFAAMLMGAGLSVWFVAAGAVVGTVGFPLFWQLLADYQRQRIFTFLNPTLDPRGAGYNAIQAMIAVGSGQLLGRGLGRGTQSHLRFLPEHHTDFIFATLVEELGFLGGVLLLILYILLLLRIVLPLLRRKHQDSRVFIYSVGLFGMLLAQIFINAGMNMGIIPITGITLPLVSYGGSSVLSTLVCFGILWAVRRGTPREHSIAI